MRISIINDAWLTKPFVTSNKRVLWFRRAAQNDSPFQNEWFVTNVFENNSLEYLDMYTAFFFKTPIINEYIKSFSIKVSVLNGSSL